MLSVIIPSHNDIYLHKTIDSILENFTGEYEIIPVLDGYVPDKPIKNDPRIRPIFLEMNCGMREAINTGVNKSFGKYIMRADEHCMFSKGFDSIILDTIQDNWIVTARRYKLDPIKWELMPNEPIDYEKLIIKNEPRKFAGVHWKNREKIRKDIAIDETMMMQGSVWVMPRRWWDDVIVRLESKGYGTLYQDTTEMVFKTWRAGGKLMVNKNTWFAHKHRSFNRTHQYSIMRAKRDFEYALSLWMPDYEKVRQQWQV